MAKKFYRALVGLSYPTEKAILDRIIKGEKVPFAERNSKEVSAGEIVSDIPDISIHWLLEQHKIEEVKDGEEKGRKETKVLSSTPSTEGEEEGEVI